MRTLSRKPKDVQLGLDGMTLEKAVWAHDGGNPNAHAFKQLEMSIKRAYQLNSGLIDSLAKAGDIVTLRAGRAWYILDNKDLKDAFKCGDWNKQNPAVFDQEAWEWTINHWYTGGLKRSVVASMDNLTSKNKNAIKQKVDELYE